MDMIHGASSLFVFADSGIYWNPAGRWVYQNSTFVDPPNVEYKPGQTRPNTHPTNQFRHIGRSNALCVDGHAESFEHSSLQYDSSHKLGFVGTTNQPYYEP